MRARGREELRVEQVFPVDYFENVLAESEYEQAEQCTRKEMREKERAGGKEKEKDTKGGQLEKNHS